MNPGAGQLAEQLIVGHVDEQLAADLAEESAAGDARLVLELRRELLRRAEAMERLSHALRYAR